MDSDRERRNLERPRITVTAASREAPDHRPTSNLHEENLVPNERTTENASGESASHRPDREGGAGGVPGPSVDGLGRSTTAADESGAGFFSARPHRERPSLSGSERGNDGAVLADHLDARRGNASRLQTPAGRTASGANRHAPTPTVTAARERHSLPQWKKYLDPQWKRYFDPQWRRENLGWLDTKLTWKWALFAILLELGMAASLIGLAIISGASQGIASLPAAWSSSSGLFGANFLWTTFPAILVGLHQRMVFDRVLDSLVSRQPFIELRRGAVASKTIMLDYKSLWEFKRPCAMWKNDHYHLTILVTFSAAISFLLGPFSANVFQVHSVLLNSPLSVQSLSSFDPSLYGSKVLANNLSFGTIIQRADASINHGSTLPQWTIVNATFPRLSLDYTNPSTFGINYSLPISAWIGDLECRAYKDSFTINGDNADFSLFDQDCHIQASIPIPSQKVSVSTWHTQDCSKSAGSSRLNFFSILRNASKGDINETTFITCTPQYLSQSGTLHIQNATLDFSPDDSNPSKLDPDNLLFNYGYQLLLPAVFDPDADFAGVDFAKLIYDYAKGVSRSQDPLSPTAMVNASREAFQAVFSLMSNTYLQKSVEPAAIQTLHGQMSSQQKRLFVYPVFAYLVAGLMLVCAAAVVAAFIYSNTHCSILHEPNKGLLSYANIAHRSKLSNLIDVAAGISHSDPELQRNSGETEPNGSVQRLNGNAAGPSQTDTAVQWDRKIVEALEKHKTLEKAEWNGIWKVENWGQRGERLTIPAAGSAREGTS